MGQRTPLYDLHLALGAKMVDFGGWDMPLHYGSQVEEHHQVRRDCGVFDVSHMTVVDVSGSQAKAYLQHLLANDVERLQDIGKQKVSLIVNEREHLPRADVSYQFKSKAGIVKVHITTAGETFKLEINAGKNPMAAQMACIELEKQLTFIALTG